MDIYKEMYFTLFYGLVNEINRLEQLKAEVEQMLIYSQQEAQEELSEEEQAILKEMIKNTDLDTD